jgi:3-methyladenine DNA glycosylase/8-oxoguanine DNA glycosylase
MSFLGPRATPGVECVSHDSYRRTVTVASRAGILEVRRIPDEPALALQVPVEMAEDLVHVVDRARWMFDCNAEPREIASHLRRDPVLKSRVRIRTGLRIPSAWDGFELAVRAVLGQQVTVAGATTLAGRLVKAHGEPLAGGDGPEPCRLFPTPEALAAVNPSRLGMPRARGATIQALARAVRDGELLLDGSADPEAMRQRLQEIPGVGEWTAQYVAMRALGESDAFPASDLGLRKALARQRSSLPRAQEVSAMAEAWRPWRAYAAMNLWREV